MSRQTLFFSRMNSCNGKRTAWDICDRMARDVCNMRQTTGDSRGLMRTDSKADPELEAAIFTGIKSIRERDDERIKAVIKRTVAQHRVHTKAPAKKAPAKKAKKAATSSKKRRAKDDSDSDIEFVGTRSEATASNRPERSASRAVAAKQPKYKDDSSDEEVKVIEK